MAYNNIDQAYTIPVNRDLQHLTSQLIAQEQQKQFLAAKQEKEQSLRQDQLTKYVGQEFRDKRYMTGTAYDPAINQKLADARTKYTDMIRRNPNINLADLDYQLQKDMSEIGGTASGIKAVRDNVKKQVASLAKHPGIDANAVEQLAMSKFMYDIDPQTGAKKPKDFSNLDPNQDYVGAAINDHPELVATGDTGFRNYIKSFQNNDLEGLNQTEVKGVTRKQKYLLNAPTYIDEIKDKNGIVTGGEVKNEIVHGVKVASQDVYEAFNTDPSTAVYLAKKFKEYNKGQTPIDPRSPEADIIKRKILFDELTDKTPIKFHLDDVQSNNNLVDKQQMGVPLYRQGLSDAMKMLNADKKLEGLDPALIMRGLGGESSVLEGSDTVKKGGKTFFDMSKQLGGFKMGKNDDGTPKSASGLLIDPVSKKIIVTTTNEMGKEVETSYQGKDIRKFVKQFAESNGVAYDKAARIVDNFMDKDGNYTKKTDDSKAIEMAAEERMAARKKQADITKSADTFSSTGNVGDLKPAIGAKTDDDGIILNVKKRSSYKIFSKPFYIEVQKGSKTETVDFQTQEELAQYLKDHTGEKKSPVVNSPVPVQDKTITHLNDKDEQVYQKWAKSNNLQTDDYDSRGLFKELGGIKPHVGHQTDKYKRPNHITFSTDSQYSNDETPGGEWKKDASGKWTYTPSAFVLTQHSSKELQDYFNKYEKEAKLILPK